MAWLLPFDPHQAGHELGLWFLDGYLKFGGATFRPRWRSSRATPPANATQRRSFWHVLRQNLVSVAGRHRLVAAGDLEKTGGRYRLGQVRLLWVARIIFALQRMVLGRAG